MPAPVRIHFSLSERRALVRGQARTVSGKTAQRITALLLLDAGVPAQTLADMLKVSRQSLGNWRRRWLRQGLAGLEEAPRSGRPVRATAPFIARLVKTAQKDPRRLGYAFSRWTAPRLSQYLSEVTHIKLSPKWIHELLQMQGLVWRRTKRSLRNLPDLREFRRARLALKRLKKGLSIRLPITSCGLVTGSASTSCPWSLIPTEGGGNLWAFPRPART